MIGMPSACLGLCVLDVHQQSWPSPSSGKAMQPSTIALEVSASTETPMPAAEQTSSRCLRGGSRPEQGSGQGAAAAQQARDAGLSRQSAAGNCCGSQQGCRSPLQSKVAGSEHDIETARRHL